MSVRGRTRSLRSLSAASADDGLEAAGRKLIEAVELARSGSVVAAYAALHGRRPNDGRLRVTHLGPAYGTKLLYFAAYEHREGVLPPLILDSRVATALGWLTKDEWPKDGWTADEYRLPRACSPLGDSLASRARRGRAGPVRRRTVRGTRGELADVGDFLHQDGGEWSPSDQRRTAAGYE